MYNAAHPIHIYPCFNRPPPRVPRSSLTSLRSSTPLLLLPLPLIYVEYVRSVWFQTSLFRLEGKVHGLERELDTDECGGVGGEGTGHGGSEAPEESTDTVLSDKLLGAIGKARVCARRSGLETRLDGLLVSLAALNDSRQGG